MGRAWPANRRDDGRCADYVILCALCRGLFTEDAAVAKLAATMIGYASIALIFDTGQSLFAMSLGHGATHGIQRLFIF